MEAVYVLSQIMNLFSRRVKVKREFRRVGERTLSRSRCASPHLVRFRALDATCCYQRRHPRRVGVGRRRRGVGHSHRGAPDRGMDRPPRHRRREAGATCHRLLRYPGGGSFYYLSHAVNQVNFIPADPPGRSHPGGADLYGRLWDHRQPRHAATRRAEEAARAVTAQPLRCSRIKPSRWGPHRAMEALGQGHGWLRPGSPRGSWSSRWNREIP